MFVDDRLDWSPETALSDLPRCSVASLMNGCSDNQREVVTLVLDDREGYGDAMAARSLSEVKGVKVASIDVKLHRARKCDCKENRG